MGQRQEELALEQREALEKAERKRQRPMLGLDESEEEGEASSRRSTASLWSFVP